MTTHHAHQIPRTELSTRSFNAFCDQEDERQRWSANAAYVLNTEPGDGCLNVHLSPRPVRPYTPAFLHFERRHLGVDDDAPYSMRDVDWEDLGSLVLSERGEFDLESFRVERSGAREVLQRLTDVIFYQESRSFVDPAKALVSIAGIDFFAGLRYEGRSIFGCVFPALRTYTTPRIGTPKDVGDEQDVLCRRFLMIAESI